MSSGDLLFLYRPWLAPNTDEIGVFGGIVDHSHRAIGSCVEVPAAEQVGRRPAGCTHLSVGAVSCVAVVNRPSSPTAADHLHPSGPLCRQPRQLRSTESWGCWGRIARLVFVPRPAGLLVRNERMVTIFAEIIGSDDVLPLPVFPRCKSGCADSSSARVYVALQCPVAELPGVARGGGRSLKPGHVALFSALVAHKVDHLDLLSAGIDSALAVAFY